MRLVQQMRGINRDAYSVSRILYLSQLLKRERCFHLRNELLKPVHWKQLKGGVLERHGPGAIARWQIETSRQVHRQHVQRAACCFACASVSLAYPAIAPGSRPASFVLPADAAETCNHQPIPH